MKASSKQINEIAQELEAGMKVYINKETLEIKSILDWEDSYSDTEIWDEDLKYIEENWSSYYIIEKMESWEAFRIMEEFAEALDDEEMSNELFKILGRKSPFANFKDEIESSPYRQNWFDFRLKRYEDYVRVQLEVEDFDIND
jgi:hypothetical protein